MAKIAGYIANLGKSVSYAAVDKVKSMSPATGEFVESNSDLFKSVYTSVRNYRVTYKRGMDIFSKSKIYEAGDVLKTSLMEDIKSGKLYNKEREDKMAMKMISGSDTDLGGDSEFNFDDIDFEDFNFDAEDVTTGDKIVSSSIDKSSRKSAEMISMVTARTGEYIVENQKMTTNLLYTQNMQTHSMLQSNLTSLNENIGSIINFSDKVVKTHVENSSNYYQETTKLMQDQTALLREIVTLLQPATKKEEKEKEKITYDDIVGANGMPDLKLYAKNIRKNVENVPGLSMLTSMNNMFGDDSNALAALVASPLKFIPEAIINTVVPKTIEASVENLDKSLSSIFASMVTKFNTMSSSDNLIESTIGQILGVRSEAKSDIDTSKYEKGKVDWDGKSRKALIEVIPTQLSKIISLLSGQQEKIYDYEKGKFINGDDIKKELESKKKGYSKSATSDMKSYMEDYAKLMTFDSLRERKKFEEDLDKFFAKLYDENKLFNVNSSTLDQDHMEYGIDSRNFRAIHAMFKKAPKYMQHQINAEILDNRNRQTKDFKELEKNGSILQYMFNGSNIDEYVNKNNLNKTSSSVLTNSLNATVDNYGRNIFFYLQNIFKELSFIRQYGKQGATTGNGIIQDPLKIVGSDGDIYSPEEKTIKDIAIPRNPRKPRADEEIERQRREEERFRRTEIKRRQKDEDLINYSDEYDDRLLGTKLSMKIDEDRVNRRIELEESRKKTIVDKLLEAENLSEKTKVMIDKVVDLSKKPTEFVASTIDKVDQRMYEFVYGKEDDNGNDIKGFLDLTLYELRNTFSKFNNFMDEKILTPLKEKLDVDSFKDGFKKLLNKMGIDTDEINKSIKTFFFGDKDSGKDGLFTSTINATKDNFKSFFGTVKDSVMNTTAPIRDKFKNKFKSRRQERLSDLDELDSLDDDQILDYINNDSSLIDKLIMTPTTGKTQEYYNSINWDTDENNLYFDKQNYVAGNRTIEKDEQELSALNEKISRLRSGLRNSRTTQARRRKLNQLTTKRDFIKNNISSFYESKDRYQNILKGKKRNNIKKYYSDSISSALELEDSSDLNNVMDNLFSNNEGNDFTVKDLMGSARKLSLDNEDGEKYESIIDKIASYVDKYYGSDIDKKLSLLSDDSGKLYDPESFRSEGLPKNSEEFYEMFPNLINSNKILLEDSNKELDSQTSLIQQIANDLKSLKDLFTGIGKTKGQQPSNLGPRLNLNPELVTTAEGRATHSFAQDLVTMISNWMYGNTPHFDKGGYIHKPTVATVGEGEIVLSAENVDKMTEVFNNIIGSVKNKEKNKKIAVGSLDALLQDTDLNIKDIKEVESILMKDKKLSDSYSSMTKQEKYKYGKILNFMNGEIQDKQEEEKSKDESFVNQVKDELLSGVNAVSRSLFGDPKEDSKKFGEVISDVTGNISTYAPDMIGKGLVGAGVSLLTGAVGGPLLGAAVGAGISLTKNSTKVQDFLFGEMIDGERQGGVVNKKIMDGIKKYLPDMKSYGITGTLAGFLTPLGPIGGLILGSSIGFAKNNESVMSTLFGEQGLFKSESKDKLMKALPKAAAGALVGGMVGPFGLMGNLILGSGIGLATSTDSFKTAILGRYDENDKEFKGGLLPAMRDAVLNPLKDFATDIKTNAVGYIKEHMLLPVTNAIDPIKKEFSLIVKSTFDSVGDYLKGMFKETFAPLNKWIEDKIMKPVGGTIVKFIKGAFKGGVGLATLPFKAVGGIGNSLRKKHIKNGNADYMTAEERLNYADKKGIRYDDSFDKYLNTLSDEEASSMFETLKSVKDSGKSARKLRKQRGTEIGNKVSTYVDYDTTKELMYHFKNGNMDKVEQLITQNKKGLFGRKKRHDLNDAQQQELLGYLNDNYEGFHNADERQQQMDKERNDLYKVLRKKGFKDIDDKNVDKYLGMLSKEMRSDRRKAKVDEKDLDPSTRVIVKLQKERHEEIVDLFNNAINAIKGIEENTETIEQRQVTKEDQESVIEKMKESIDDKPVTKIDEHGNVMEFKRTRDGELKADTSDSSTVEAMKLADEDDAREQSILDIMKSKLGGNREDKEGDDKKEKKGLLGKILGLLGGFGKLLSPKVLGALGTAIVAMPVIPKLVEGFMKDGWAGVAEQLPSLLLNGIKTGLTEVLPGTIKGFYNLFNKKDGDDKSIMDNAKDTAMREVLTGGELSKAGLKSANKVANGIDNIGKAEKAAEGGSKILRAGKNVMKAMSPVTYMKMGAKASLHTIPKFAFKGIEKAADAVHGVHVKIDEKTGLNKLSSSIKTKAGKYVEKTAAGIVDNTAVEKVLASQDQTMVSKLINTMSNFFIKLFNNPMVVKIIGAEHVEKLSKEWVPKFLKQLSESILKQGGKISAKLAGLATTGGLVNIAFAITDFISGYNDAQDILGISEDPTFVMKVASGLLRSINGLFIITSLIPEKVYVDLIFDTLMPILGMKNTNLQKMRQDAKDKAEAYKKQNKIKGNFTVQDYNNKMRQERKKANPKDRNGDGKVSLLEKGLNFGSSVVNKVKQFGSNAWNTTKDVVSSIATGVSNVASGAWNGIKNVASGAWNWLMGKGGESAGKGASNSGGNYPSRINNFTYYSQADPKWNTKSIDGTSVKVAGCGPTSMAMIVSELTGQAHHPDEFVQDAYSHGQWSRNGANWTMFKYFADKYNLPYQEAGTYENFQKLAAAGIPQAVSGKKRGVEGSPFTNGGHIITVLGTDGNGNYIVNDPVSANRSKLYPNDIIQKGWRNSWGFGNPGTYDPNKAGVTPIQGGTTTGQTQEAQPEAQSGLSGLFSDFTSAATKTIDKIYGFDQINQQSTTNSDFTAGMGGLIDDKVDINPLAATDFENEPDTVSKIKKALNKAGNVLLDMKPIKVATTTMDKMKESLHKESKEYYNGQGGVDAPMTVKTVKGIPIGSKPLNQKVTSYDSIFQSAGSEFGVDPELLKAICMQESKGEPLKGAAWGLMQIEGGGTTDEFIKFGKNRPNGPYTSGDRLDPSKAIPFAAKRLSEDFKLYNGDYLKTTQAYNFSRYSLNALLKAFPNGDEWIKQRANVGQYNGTGKKKYGDPQYIEHVFQYYQGNKIPSDGVGTVSGGTGVAAEGATEQRSGFSGLMADLGDLLTNGFNKLYGLDEILGTPTTGGAVGQSDPSAIGLDPNSPKVSDDWFTKSLGARVTSPYGPRRHPISGKQSMHRGIDYATAQGTDIKTPVDGTVEANIPESQSGGFGNLLKLKDTSGGTHFFAHMQQRSPLQKGATIRSGQSVGKVGSTGNSTGPHLHYEIRTGAAKGNDHTEPNGYLSRLFGGKGGVDAPLRKLPTGKYNGKGGVDAPIKPVKLPNITRKGSIPKQTKELSETKLLSIIIEVLSKIADNTSSLSDIVQLLSRSLNVDIPEESIKQLKSNKESIKGGNKQIVSIIKDSVKNSQNPDNLHLLETLDKLAME